MTDTKFAPITRQVYLHGKTPHVRHVRMSYSMLLRDKIVQLLKAKAEFATFTFSTDRARQIEPESLPFCGVYFVAETGTAGAEPQTGPVEMRTITRIGFSVIIVNNDPVAGEYMLDRMYQNIVDLMRDPALYRPSAEVRVQGYTGTSRQHIFGNTGQNNETPIAELRLELLCDLGTITFDPEITDDLEVIHVTTSYPFTPDGTPPVVREYDVQQ